jgi:hypothetical protein
MLGVVTLSFTNPHELAMENTHLDAPLFIQQVKEKTVNIDSTPFFYNEAGEPRYLKKLPAKADLLPALDANSQVAIGNEYVVPEVIGVKKTPYGIETQLGFLANEMVYEPMWVTPAIAAAFGITLVEPGQAVRMQSPVAALSQVEYKYGVFAGHWSPYENTGNKLLSIVSTDLEHHDFPHVFASTDAHFPLVTSVARYWPQLNKIRVADLWVPRGSALYIPPKPSIANAPHIDLHNNRNSARACWGNIRRDHITTKTLLQTQDGFFYWYWNGAPTVHTQPSVKR